MANLNLSADHLFQNIASKSFNQFRFCLYLMTTSKIPKDGFSPSTSSAKSIHLMINFKDLSVSSTDQLIKEKTEVQNY